VLAEQGALAVGGERPAVQQHLAVRGQRRGRRVDRAQQEPQLVQAGERGQPAAAQRQEHPPAQPRQRGRRRGFVGHPVPAVAAAGGPARPAQHHQPRPGARDGLRGVPDHRRGERVGRVDEHVGGVRAQPLGQPAGAAEPADPDLAGRQRRQRHPTGQRRGDDEPRPAVQRRGQRGALRGAAQDQHVHGTDSGVGGSRRRSR
jgi:hypothetical protein